MYIQNKYFSPVFDKFTENAGSLDLLEGLDDGDDILRSIIDEPVKKQKEPEQKRSEETKTPEKWRNCKTHDTTCKYNKTGISGKNL